MKETRGTGTYSRSERALAAIYGVACHASFGAGIMAMMAGMYLGLTGGFGPFRGGAAVVTDVLLVAQFPIAHSILLSRHGRRRLARLAPKGLGPDLSTTTYAMIASWQLLATFALWSPSGVVWWWPTGKALWTLSALYAVAWSLLLKTMVDAGLALQTGFLGWGSVVRGYRPRYASFSEHGTFRWVRHPIYVAFSLTLWTAPVWTPDRFTLAVGWTVYCLVGPLLKEQRYLRIYGAAFEAYRRRVPYWIPGWRADEDPSALRPE
jgi:protein-S-isoprenylcysteine O-methyltransferase Ste14